MEAQKEKILALKASSASQLEVRKAVEEYAAERVRTLKESQAPLEEVKEAVATYVGLLAAPLISVSAAEAKLKALEAAAAPQAEIDLAFGEYRDSVEATERARVEVAAVKAQKVCVPPVVMHTVAEEKQTSHGTTESKQQQDVAEEKQLEFTCRPLKHPLAPHVYLGFCDIGMVGVRLLSSLVPSGLCELVSEEPLTFSQSLDACWKGPPLLVKSFGRNKVAELSLVIINSQLTDSLAPLVSHALVDLLSVSGVRQVTVFAGVYLVSSAPASTVHWASFHMEHVPELCSKCQLAKPLPSLVSFKEPLLSSLAFFLRISSIPTLFLLMSAKRYHLDQDDGTRPILETLGELISKATTHSNGGLQLELKAPTSAPRVAEDAEPGSFYF